MDEIYHKHMKKKQEFERKMWEQRKQNYIKEELEYQELQNKYHSQMIHEDDLWRITD